MVCGLMFCLAPLTSLAGVVLGHLARGQLRREPGLRGSGMATTGLVTGYLFTLLGVLFIFWMVTAGATALREARQKVEQAQRDSERKLQEAKREIEQLERPAPANRPTPARRPGGGIAYREPKLPLPDDPAKGRVGASEFAYEHALLENGWLTLRQGPDFLADVEVKVVLFESNAKAEGKTYTVGPTSRVSRPHLHMTWQEGGSRKSGAATDKYTMTLTFGKFEDGQVRGSIDVQKSGEPAVSVKGNFVARVK